MEEECMVLAFVLIKISLNSKIFFSMSISKRIFIISSVLLATVLFFMAIYNVSFKKEENSGSVANNEVKTEETKETGITEKIEKKLSFGRKEKIYPLTDRAVISPIIDKSKEKIIYYEKPNGSVYEVSFDGENKNLIDDNDFIGLENVYWNLDKNKVISRFNNNGKIQYSSYDYDLKRGYKLADGIEYATWNNLGDQMIYKYSDSKNGKRTINVANYDGSSWKKIIDIQSNNSWISSIPQSPFISYWNMPNAFEETSLNIISTAGGGVRKIFSGRFGADYLWSPNGTKALVSSSDVKGGSKISLALINNNGGEFQNLNIPTFVSKCVWSKDDKTVYYSLPSISSDNYVLPNDYMNRKINSKDTFWKLDIGTGKTERVVDVSEIKDSYDATNLFLSPSEDNLFFVNRIDEKLYGVSL